MHPARYETAEYHAASINNIPVVMLPKLPSADIAIAIFFFILRKRLSYLYFESK